MIASADLIREKTDAEDANIIFGTVVDARMQGAVRITVLATGFQNSGGSKKANAANAATTTTPSPSPARMDTIFSRGAGTEPTTAPSASSSPAGVASDVAEERAEEKQKTATATTDMLDIPTFLRRR